MRSIQTKADFLWSLARTSRRPSRVEGEGAGEGGGGGGGIGHVLGHRVEALGVHGHREGPARAVEDGAAAGVEVEGALALPRALLLEELAPEHLHVHEADADHERPERDREREQHQPQARLPLARGGPLPGHGRGHEGRAVLPQGLTSGGVPVRASRRGALSPATFSPGGSGFSTSITTERSGAGAARPSSRPAIASTRT